METQVEGWRVEPGETETNRQIRLVQTAYDITQGYVVAEANLIAYRITPEHADGTERILTYGDSVAWGCNDDEKAERLAPGDRFPVVLLGYLALQSNRAYTSFEYAVNGMTTDQDRVDRPGRNGLEQLPQVLEKVQPHTIVLHLGLNDLNNEIHRDAKEAAEGVTRNISAIIAHNTTQDDDNKVKRVIVLGPSFILGTDRFKLLALGDYFPEEARKQSLYLGPEIHRTVDAFRGQQPDIDFSFLQIDMHAHKRPMQSLREVDGLHIGAMGQSAIAQSIANVLLDRPGAEFAHRINGTEAYHPNVYDYMLPSVDSLAFRAIVRHTSPISRHNPYVSLAPYVTDFAQFDAHQRERVYQDAQWFVQRRLTNREEEQSLTTEGPTITPEDVIMSWRRFDRDQSGRMPVSVELIPCIQDSDPVEETKIRLNNRAGAVRFIDLMRKNVGDRRTREILETWEQDSAGLEYGKVSAFKKWRGLFH